MLTKCPAWPCLLVSFVVSTTDIAFGAAINKTFPSLTIGLNTYTNVTITDVSGGSIFLRHSRGFESLRIDSVDAKTLAELGIQAPAPQAPRSNAGSAKTTAPIPTAESSQVEEPPAAARQLRQLGSRAVPEGIPGMILISLSVIGMLMIVIGWIMFVISAFRAGPWWGVGVFFAGLSCGIVPLIYFFTHLEESKRAFFCTAGGIALMTLSGIIGINIERTKAAVKAKERAALVCHEPARV